MMGLLTAQAATTLVATAWEGLVLAGLVAATLRILPGIAAAARSMVWTAAMVAVCALPVLHRVCGANTTTTRVVLGDQVAVALIAAWLGMSVWRGTQLLRSAVWLQGVWRRAVVIGDADQSQPRLAGSMLRKATNPPVCLSDEIDRPCVVGFCAPRILIPTSLWGRLSPEQLQQIVLHETAHLGRADDWINLLQKLSLVAFPLNPGLLWIERELCIERELACDDQVLKATGARRAYAACLTNLAEHRLLQRGVSLALGAWERQSELGRRVKRILQGGPMEMGVRTRAGAIATILVGIVVVAAGLGHSPTLVAFGSTAPTVAANQPKPPAIKSGAHLYTPANFEVAAPKVRLARATKHTLAVHPATRPKVKLAIAKLEAPEQEPMVLVVTWQTATAGMFENLTYAAVPTRHGWLFVQL